MWREKKKMSFQLRHPFTSVIAGPTQSGKTEFTLTLIANVDEVIEPSPNRIIWCYGEDQEKLNRLPKWVEKSDTLDILDTLDSNERNLVILDDLMDESSKNENISKLFTKGSHHRNLSVILITQNLFYQSNIMRTINRNVLYLIVFKNPRDSAQISYLGRQMFPNKSKYVLDAYKQATDVPHGYLLMDFTQKADERQRLLTGILPGEDAAVFVPR